MTLLPTYKLWAFSDVDDDTTFVFNGSMYDITVGYLRYGVNSPYLKCLDNCGIYIRRTK